MKKGIGIYLLGGFVLILALTLALFYSYMNFRTGDFVYSRDKMILGEVKGVPFPFNYLVLWADNTYTYESFLKLEDLEDVNQKDLISLSEDKEKVNSSYVFNQKTSNRTGIASEGFEGSFDGTGSIFLGSIVEKGAGGKFILAMGEENCEPNYICEGWGNCETVYDLDDYISDRLVSGVQYRYCRDYNNCLTDFIDSRICETKIPIELRRVIIEGVEYVEVYDLEGVLISRVNLEEYELNIDLLFE